MENNMLWVNKYNPTHINDIIMDFKQKKFLNTLINQKKFCNLILSGISGIGKTCIVRYCCKRLYGENMRLNMAEISSSDSRKFDDMKQDIDIFCKQKVMKPLGAKRYPDFKIIFVDEADNITVKMQQLIISMLNNNSLTKIIFVFTCNLSTKMDDAIKSKCQMLHMNTFSLSKIEDKLKKICDAEKKKSTPEGLKLISYISAGDIRQSITLLQSICIEGDVTEDMITKNRGMPCIKILEDLLIFCYEKKLSEAILLIIKLLKEGYNSYDIVFLIVIILKSNSLRIQIIDMEIKIKYLYESGILLNNIVKGHKSNIQLYGTIAELCRQKK